mgnify:CR=1 FL=1
MCIRDRFTGNHQAAPILLYGLSRLEYRGYDSAGLAVRDGEGDTEVIKAKGRLKVLADKTNNGESVPGTCGIGHTRWATHGEPSETNAHPHMSDDGNVVAVHNGIIENYQELKDKLIRNGYEFYSSTDTEVAVKLVDYYYKKYLGTPVDAINHAMVRIRGSYALAIMFKDYPGEIYVARKDSPMILGVENGESYIASDVPAILKYTRNVYYIGNLEMARIRKGEITFYNLDGDEIQKEPKTIEWDAEAAEKAGFEHYEISNFCRPGKYSRHNSSYWKGIPYLGCGPSAHSFDGMTREWNVSSIDTYIKGIEENNRAFEIEYLDQTTRYNEFIITTIRTVWGTPIEKLKQMFGNEMWEYCQRMAAPYLKNGKLEEHDGALRLTREGIFISDSIMSDLLWVD